MSYSSFTIPYGFPVDLTADIARERDLTVDQAGFEKQMGAQRDRARAASKFASGVDGGIKTESLQRSFPDTKKRSNIESDSIIQGR